MRSRLHRFVPHALHATLTLNVRCNSFFECFRTPALFFHRLCVFGCGFFLFFVFIYSLDCRFACFRRKTSPRTIKFISSYIILCLALLWKQSILRFCFFEFSFISLPTNERSPMNIYLVEIDQRRRRHHFESIISPAESRTQYNM